MTPQVRRFAIAAAAALVAAMPVAAQTTGEKLLIEAFAVNMSNIGTGANAQVQIYVDRWSTAAERELLLASMVQKGPRELLKALQNQTVKGRFQIPTLTGPDPHNLRLGLQLRYASQAPLPEGGRRIVLAADRYIGMAEAQQQPRSIDYPFTLFEVRVNKDGEGEGKLAYATKIRFDKDNKVMEIENYASEPVRLNNVRVKVRR
jgi:hypothetical protein